MLLVLKKFDFHDTWVGWIKMCIESMSYFVIVNHESVGPIVSDRGLRQGEPLSPLCESVEPIEGLTSLIHQSLARGDIHGVDICREAPTITHLLFVDNCVLFFRASHREMENMKRVLDVYEKASGEQIFFQKS